MNNLVKVASSQAKTNRRSCLGAVKFNGKNLREINKELLNYRSNHLEVFLKRGALKTFAIFTRKHMCWSLFY